MRMLSWIAFVVATAYCADIAFYGGIHAEATITLTRNIARGILLGLMRFT